MSTPQYITLDDMKDLFSTKEVEDLQTKHGLDMARIVELTNAEVDGYLEPLRGKAVLVSIPQSVKMRAASMARFYAMTKVLPESSPEKTRWEAAIRFFERVSEGKQPLVLDLADNPDTEGDDVADASGVWSERGRNTLDDREFGSSFW